MMRRLDITSSEYTSDYNIRETLNAYRQFLEKNFPDEPNLYDLNYELS